MNNIFLVRHGESLGNVDRTTHKRLPDHAIPLSEEGKEQAFRAGQWLDRKWFEFLPRNCDPLDPHPEIYSYLNDVRMWTSPYARTRQTAETFVAGCDKFHGETRENILLCEQQFGLFDGLSDEELQEKYPDEHAFYQKCEDFEGRFWARMPLGESRFDVAARVQQFFGTLHRDKESSNVYDVIIICHGVTMRAFLMMWCHYSPEWFEKEPNPKNCAIRLIQNNQDKGYIYEGG